MVNERAPSLQAQIRYVGHATVCVEIDGVRLLTDPILRQWVGPLRRHAPPVEPAWHDRIDAVLISHLHYDHLDRASLCRVGMTTPVIVPPGAGPLVRGWGFANVDELAAGRSMPIGPITIEATPAKHSGFRPPFGPSAACLGFLARGSERVYFAGDTDLFPEMSDLAPDLDVALLPVWGWGPTLGSGHLDPRRAAIALTMLQPRIAIPIHWGSLAPAGLRWLRAEVHSRPPLEFARHAQELAPAVGVHVVQPGDALTLAR